MKVLLTGFEPFDGEAINPSWEAVRALDGWPCGPATVHARQMPCVFGLALEALAGAIAELQPDLVICVGQAGGRSEISVERVAINLDDGRIADNAGHQPIDSAVVVGGPAAYFATLPIKAMVRDLRAAGIPAAVSNTAGTFVCNHIFYGLIHQLAMLPDQTPVGVTRGGFIHIPYLPQQATRFAGAPSMALTTMIDALRVAIRTALTVRDDVREIGGQLH
jgi:pyroglutamyl-peptidase